MTPHSGRGGSYSVGPGTSSGRGGSDSVIPDTQSGRGGSEGLDERSYFDVEYRDGVWSVLSSVMLDNIDDLVGMVLESSLEPHGYGGGHSTARLQRSRYVNPSGHSGGESGVAPQGYSGGHSGATPQDYSGGHSGNDPKNYWRGNTGNDPQGHSGGESSDDVALEFTVIYDNGTWYVEITEYFQTIEEVIVYLKESVGQGYEDAGEEVLSNFDVLADTKMQGRWRFLR